MTRIALGQCRNHLDDALLALVGNREINRSADNHIAECRRMQMAAFTLHVDASRLLHHAIVIVHVLRQNTTCLVQRLLVFLWQNLLVHKLLPATAMNQHTLAQIGLIAALNEFLAEVLPNHERKSEHKDGLAFMLLQEFLHSLHVQLHVLAQRIHTLTTEHRETKDSGTTGREYIAVLYHSRSVQNQHRHTVSSDECRNNLC